MAHNIMARLATVFGLAVCAGLLLETLSGSASCGHAGGCDEVLHSAWGRPAGVPLPAVGLALFASLLALSLRGPAWAFRLLALAGGAGGLGLVVVQAAVLRRYCPFCLAVDAAAVVAALSALGGESGRASKAGQTAWLAAGVAGAVAGGAAWLLLRPVAPPAEILALTRPDRVTVVEIADFRCGHCRVMHRVLDTLEAQMGDRIHRVCLVTPTPGRPESAGVARALRCARQQGRGRAMIDRLFAGPHPTPELCRASAQTLGLSLPAFDACLAGPEDEGDDEMEWLRAASPRGVPAVWMDGRLLDGVRGGEKMRAAVEAAERRRGIPPPR